jgi:hypothetical protein
LCSSGIIKTGGHFVGFISKLQTASLVLISAVCFKLLQINLKSPQPFHTFVQNTAAVVAFDNSTSITFCAENT